MSSVFSPILHHFGITEGLVRGTGLVSRAVGLACYTLLPGFGATGFLIAGSVQMTVNGLLEIPTGLVADRFGPSRSLLLAFILKIFVTLALFAAVFCSMDGATTLMWAFLAAEAVIDAFACAFQDGAYQAFYLRWYESRCAHAGAKASAIPPPLFTASYRFALAIRIGIPILAVLCVYGFYELTASLGVLGTYPAAFLTLGVITFLRFLVLYRVWRDVRSSQSPELAKPLVELRRKTTLREIFGSFSGLSSRGRILLAAYALIVFVSSAGTFYFVGELFRSIKLLPISADLGWVSGVLSAVAIYISQVLIARRLYPRLAEIDLRRGIIFFSSVLGALALASGLMISRFESPLANCAFLFFFSLSVCVIAQGIQRQMESMLDQWIPQNIQSTWISGGEALGILVYGVSTGIIAYLRIEEFTPTVLCLLIFFACLMVLGISLSSTEEDGRQSIATVLRGLFIRCFCIFLFIFALVDSFKYTFEVMSEEREKQVKITQQAAQLVGRGEKISHVRAQVDSMASLAKLNSVPVELCFSPAGKTSECAQSLERREKRFVRPISADVVVPDGARSEVFRLYMAFNEKSIIRHIEARFGIFIALFIVSALLTSYLSRRFVRVIKQDLDALKGLAKQPFSDVEHHYHTSELKILAGQQRILTKLREDYVKAQAEKLVATQVAHDIRSPLTVLKVILSGNATHEKERNAIAFKAIDRIENISNCLLAKKRLAAGPLSATEVKSHNLYHLLDSLLVEKRVQYLEKYRGHLNLTSQGEVFDLHAKVDPVAFERAVSNLIDNALEWTNEFSGKVTVSLGRNGSNAVVSVTDNGPGIPTYLISQLGSQRVRSRRSGNGLGVLSAKNAVESFSGTLEFHTSALGTTARVSIPAA